MESPRPDLATALCAFLAWPRLRSFKAFCRPWRNSWAEPSAAFAPGRKQEAGHNGRSRLPAQQRRPFAPRKSVQAPGTHVDCTAISLPLPEGRGGGKRSLRKTKAGILSMGCVACLHAGGFLFCMLMPSFLQQTQSGVPHSWILLPAQPSCEEGEAESESPRKLRGRLESGSSRSSSNSQATTAPSWLQPQGYQRLLSAGRSKHTAISKINKKTKLEAQHE